MNRHKSGSFDDFLKEDGIFQEGTKRALKRLLIWQLEDTVKVLIQQQTTFVEKVSPSL